MSKIDRRTNNGTQMKKKQHRKIKNGQTIQTWTGDKPRFSESVGISFFIFKHLSCWLYRLKFVNTLITDLKKTFAEQKNKSISIIIAIVERVAYGWSVIQRMTSIFKVSILGVLVVKHDNLFPSNHALYLLTRWSVA